MRVVQNRLNERKKRLVLCCLTICAVKLIKRGKQMLHIIKQAHISEANMQ